MCATQFYDDFRMIYRLDYGQRESPSTENQGNVLHSRHPSRLEIRPTRSFYAHRSGFSLPIIPGTGGEVSRRCSCNFTRTAPTASTPDRNTLPGGCCRSFLEEPCYAPVSLRWTVPVGFLQAEPQSSFGPNPCSLQHRTAPLLFLEERPVREGQILACRDIRTVKNLSSGRNSVQQKTRSRKNPWNERGATLALPSHALLTRRRVGRNCDQGVCGCEPLCSDTRQPEFWTNL